MASKQAQRNQELLKAYREETNPRKKSRIEGQIVLENLPFVKMKANKFLVRSHVHLEIEDLLQVGMIGLLTAIRKDKSKSSFTTYANWWLYHEYQALAAKTQPVHRPKGAGMPFKSFRAMEAIKAATNEEATDEQLGLKPGSVEEWRQSPAFFPLEDGDETRKDTEEALSRGVKSAEDVFMELEDDEQLSLALDMLSDDQRVEIERFLEGAKPISPDGLAAAIEEIRFFLQDE